MSAIPWRKLWQTQILSPRGLYALLRSLIAEGPNLAALLAYARRLSPNETAIHTETERSTYRELYKATHELSCYLQNELGVCSRQRVGILGSNSIALSRYVFALSRLGADVYLLSSDLSSEQLVASCERLKIKQLFVDEEKAIYIDALPIHILKEEVGSAAAPYKHKRLAPGKAGRLVVMTGGSSGRQKEAARRPSPFAFLYPLFALLTDVKVDSYRSVFIATPIFHGFGLATLIVAVLLRRTIYLQSRFEAQAASRLIAREKIEVLILVPLMLGRILNAAPESLASLRAILSGGAPLNERLAAETYDQLGPVLYNLYGTSEAGFFILATPDALRKYPGTLGRAIRGVKTKVEKGCLWVSSGWAMEGKRSRWQNTGDRARINDAGYVWLLGRNDSMAVSGGENVYPEDLERVLLTHPSVLEASVLVVLDEEFGQRLAAYIVRGCEDPFIDEATLRAWLKAKVSRYEMPRDIHFVNAIPLLDSGKVSRQALIN